MIFLKDNGHPVKNKAVPLTLTVMSPQELEENQDENETKASKEDNESVHPPVFAEHLYFADYTNNHFRMEEPIVITYGAQSNTKLKQLGKLLI